MKVEYYEPHTDERVAAAQAKAQRILTGTVETEAEFILALITIIDRDKKLGLFCDYYKNRTLDELVFEAEIVRGKPLEAAEAGHRAIEGAGQDAKTELGDWIEKELTADADFMKDAEKFMQTGEFKT